MHVKKIKILQPSSSDRQDGKIQMPIGTEIVAKDINLLVGDQGVGKSTLLKALQRQDRMLEITLSEEVLKNGIDNFYFDSEHQNPRIRDLQDYSDIRGHSTGIGPVNAFKSRYFSHGEIMAKITVDNLRKTENCVLLFDEPEAGLSIKNQYRLAEEIKKLPERNVQIFLSTHSLILIQECAEEIYSLEHCKFLKPKEFISYQKKKAKQL